MIQFSDLSLSTDMTSLTIQCSGTASERIARVYLEYYKNYSVGEPSDKAYLVAEYSGENCPSSINLTVFASAISITGTDTFENGLFYVYVQYYPTSDNSLLLTATGVVIDWGKVYVEAMTPLKELATDCNKCTDHQDLIDFILRWEALKLAIDTCDWDTVHCLWSQLFVADSFGTKDCGCS